MVGFLAMAAGNTAKVFKLVKHAFNDVTLFVQMPVAPFLFLAIGLEWNHRHNFTLSGSVKQSIGVTLLVSQTCIRATNVLNEGDRLNNAGRLPPPTTTKMKRMGKSSASVSA